MPLHLDIPESIARSLKLPSTEIEPRLRAEVAVVLYAQGILFFGKASELAEVSRIAFADLLSQGNMPRHYTEEELTQDLAYARRQQCFSHLMPCHYRPHRAPQISVLRSLDSGCYV